MPAFQMFSKCYLACQIIFFFCVNLSPVKVKKLGMAWTSAVIEVRHESILDTTPEPRIPYWSESLIPARCHEEDSTAECTSVLIFVYGIPSFTHIWRAVSFSNSWIGRVGLINLERSSTATLLIDSMLRLIDTVSVISGGASCFKRLILAACSSVVRAMTRFLTEQMSFWCFLCCRQQGRRCDSV